MTPPRGRARKLIPFVGPPTVVVLALAVVFAPGCGGEPEKVTTVKGEGVGQVQDGRGAALDVIAAATDPDKAHAGLRQLDQHLGGDAEARKAIEEGTAALRPLQQRLGLDPDELAEVTDPAFRRMDAHHVALCQRLRDAAGALRLHALPPLRRAQVAFDWVVRHVTLQDAPPEGLLPPEAVLLQGKGTADERALLFLALLRQVDLDGCMVACPGGQGGRPRYWLPGVLVQEGKAAAEVYLFDTRLGVPLPGPGGEGVATLRQVRAQPALLAGLARGGYSYDVTAEQAKQAEPHLVLPLSALAPRLRHVESLLANRDRARLAADTAALFRRFEAAAGGEVKVWNWPGEPGRPRPVTPTRALRLLLPPAEGGVGEGDRWAALRLQLVPFSHVIAHYQALGFYDALPPDAQKRLRDIPAQLFLKYYLVPHERVTRGRLEEATRRLVQIEAVLRQRAAAPPPEAAQKQIEEWVERVRRVHLAVARGQPNAEREAAALWAQDQYLLALADLGEEDAIDPKQERKLERGLLSYLVLGAVEGPLGGDAAFLLALCWQEKAAQAQARLGNRDGQAAGAREGEEAAAAWTNARALAELYAGNHPLGAAAVRARLQKVLAAWRGEAQRIDVALDLWSYLFRDLRRGASARLFQARALRQTRRHKEADAVLLRLDADLTALRTGPDMKAALEECLKLAEGLPAHLQPVVAARLRGLQRELGEGSTFWWLGYAARLQAAPKG